MYAFIGLLGSLRLFVIFIGMIGLLFSVSILSYVAGSLAVCFS